VSTRKLNRKLLPSSSPTTCLKKCPFGDSKPICELKVVAFFLAHHLFDEMPVRWQQAHMWVASCCLLPRPPPVRRNARSVTASPYVSLHLYLAIPVCWPSSRGKNWALPMVMCQLWLSRADLRLCADHRVEPYDCRCRCCQPRAPPLVCFPCSSHSRVGAITIAGQSPSQSS
jgi:hypothetical protein